VNFTKRKIQNNLRRIFVSPFFRVSLLAQNIVWSRGISSITTKISVQELCSRDPKRINNLFANLDLDRQGLETVKTAIRKGDLPDACEALIAYYQNSNAIGWLRQPAQKAVVICK
jgi:Heparinase II/III N-terminus